MSTTVITLGENESLTAALRRDMKARERRCEKALLPVARAGVRVMREDTMPKAFGDLMDSAKAKSVKGGAETRVSAPHAAAVENGSRPHWVPLEALIKWVKLRGLQGLKSTKRLAKSKGSTTFKHARSIASAINSRMLADGSDAIAIDAPEQIAREIQVAIAKHGTKPQWYAKRAVPRIQDFVHYYMEEAVLEKASTD